MTFSGNADGGSQVWFLVDPSQIRPGRITMMQNETNSLLHALLSDLTAEARCRLVCCNRFVSGRLG